jgi:Amt family ammonium transporter
MALLGCFILAFGWFGFNAGSTLSATDLRISVIAVNTMLASASGTFAAMVVAWLKYGKPDPALCANGMLAGLVAITAPCAFVNSVSAVIIGAIAGVLLVYGLTFVERKLRVDDPVGAITVHGINGAWGVLSLGLFADGSYGDGWNGVPGAVRGLFYGDASQLAAQTVGTLANFVWVFGTAYLAMKIIGGIVGNRVSEEVELQGLDIPEMGVPAYPDYVTIDSSSPGSASPVPASGMVPNLVIAKDTVR